MKRRRKAKAPGLRELARAERWDEVRRLLEERLALDPRDDEARAELERLNQGLPLRVLESPLARQKRLEKEMREELAAELELYRRHPALIEEWDAALLAKRRKRVALIRSTLAERMDEAMEEDAARYLDALSARLEQHRGKHRTRLRLLYALVPVAALVLAASGLEYRAQSAGSKLEAALDARDPARVEATRKAADSGVNRLLNDELPDLLERAQTWQTRVQRQSRELAAKLDELEAGKSTLSGMPLVLRAHLEGELQREPKAFESLRQRWQRLRNKEKAQLAAQREEVEKRFSAPLPGMPELGGTLEEDETALRQQLEQLRGLAEECRAACQLFALAPALVEPMESRLAELRQLLADIAALRRATALLPRARSYADYRRFLADNAPQSYAPAIRLMQVRENLPEEDKLRDLMQDHGRQLPPGMLEAARHALLEGGPSFTAAFPANAKQVQLMEDVFTSTALQKPLYEMSAPGLPSYIVEERPEAGAESVSFTPSPVTPGYSLSSPKQVTWTNPGSVSIRRIDATPLVRDTGISREDFFRCGNLPRLLDRLLQMDEGAVPVLARAYLFQRLLDVMRAHEWPTMLGIAYAPTLRADACSFAKLVRETGFPLTSVCWLQSTPEAARAEEAYRRWFAEHRYNRYAREIANNFGTLVQVHPRYVGYIDAAGHPQLFRKLRAGTLLWYVSADGLTTAPLGEEPEGATPFSPVFVVERD